MHASHVAILVLAASAASPVFSAPLAARGAAGVPATSDVVARGFSTSVFSNVNKGTKAVKRDVPLDDIQASDAGVKAIISVMKGLFGNGPVDDVKARGFDTGIFSNLNKGTQALRARGLVKGLINGLEDVFSLGLIVRDDVDDSVLEDALLQAISRRDVSELEARKVISGGAVLQTIKDILQVISRRDVTPEQLIALASLTSTPLNSLD
ncbi:hypothetical protein H4582DRAFT_1054286 [Lactarius indigo]|nr:hypothetical protein H4582DRAFT_1054286 [Lactarius indigo]